MAVASPPNGRPSKLCLQQQTITTHSGTDTTSLSPSFESPLSASSLVTPTLTLSPVPSIGAPPSKPKRSPLRPTFSRRLQLPPTPPSEKESHDLPIQVQRSQSEMSPALPPPIPEKRLSSMPTDYWSRNRSYPSFEDLNTLHSEKLQAQLVDSPLERLSPVDYDGPASSTSSLVPSGSSAVMQASSVSLAGTTAPAVPKRTHALLELLSSERAYASDLALIRDIHIPLALGLPAPFQNAPLSPPTSSSSSSRTVSTASDSSSGSQQQLGPPMSREDSKIIFSNVSELAMFADVFSEKLEGALGGLLEGGQGEDSVGALFLDIIPMLEPPYKNYITRHPAALNHLNSLAQTPALTAYLQQTRTLASSLSYAWDLPSLLIKPVQRLLKYSLLLQTIIEETPDAHSDKENLRKAKEKMEEVARGVNEDRRRWEVVKEVLGTKPGETSSASSLMRKKGGLPVGIAASVNLGKMKSLKTVGKQKEGNEEAMMVSRLEKELRRLDVFVNETARCAVQWSTAMSNVMSQLRTWAEGFGKVIGLSDESHSEAFDAFFTVVKDQLPPMCVELDKLLKSTLLRELAMLLETTRSPLRLLDAMHTLEPLHYGLLNLNYAKNARPPPALLEASQSYLALRGQLAAELPTYLALLHGGVAGVIVRLADLQAVFWRDVRDRWAELWDALRVEGEMNGGALETERVWWGRWCEVDKGVGSLGIVSMKRLHVEREREREEKRYAYSSSTPSSHSSSRSGAALSNLDPSPRNHTKANASPQVVPMMTAPEPTHSVGPFVSSPFPLLPSSSFKTPKKQSPSLHTTASTSSGGGLGKKRSTESLFSVARSMRPGKSRGSSKHPAEDLCDYVPVGLPLTVISTSPNGGGMSYARRKSTSSDGPAAVTPSSASVLSTSTGSRGRDPSHSQHSSQPLRSPPHQYHYQTHSDQRGQYPDVDHGDDDERGRPSSKPNLRRMLTDTLRPSPAKPKRSSSAKSVNSTISPKKQSFQIRDASPQPALPPSPHRSQHNSGHGTPTHVGQSSWNHALPKYACRVVHPCYPPPGVSYFGFPFFTLEIGKVYWVLKETGHPGLHEDLPLYVDDGEDCLLLVRSARGEVGWALASFLIPED